MEVDNIEVDDVDETYKIKMIKLNKNFLAHCIKKLEESSDYCLVPLFKDYLIYTQEILKNNSEPFVISKETRDAVSLQNAAQFFNFFDNTNGQQQNHTSSENNSPLPSSSLKSNNNGFSFPKPKEASGLGSGDSLNKVKIGFQVPSTTTTNTTIVISSTSTTKSFSAPLFNFGPSTTSSSIIGKIKDPKSNSSMIMPIMESTVIEEKKNDSPTSKSSFGGGAFNFSPIPSVQSSNISSLPSTMPALFTPAKIPTFSMPSGPPSTTAPSTNDDDENYEPPKPEFSQVVEDEHLYSVKCKLFRLIEGKYKDGGIGILYVKKLDTGKHQLVVRAENSLGTLLLNMILSSDFPLNREGKNNVKTVDPTGKDGPVSMLIRVKDSDAADSLLGKLKEFVENQS